MASSLPSSTASSTAIMSSVPTSRTLSSNNTKSTPPSCATSWSPTTSPISNSGRDWTTSRPCASGSRTSPAALPASRRNGSTSMLTFHCCNIRLLEILLHGSTHVGGWTTNQIHQAVLTTFHLSDKRYGLNQLRYDLRKLKGHGLLQRDGSRYAYRLTPKGVQVALLFLFFH